MIKFNTTLGARHLNAEARELSNALKPYIKGMRCSKCKTDTIINFIDDGYGHLKPSIQACCNEFKLRVQQKITFG